MGNVPVNVPVYVPVNVPVDVPVDVPVNVPVYVPVEVDVAPQNAPEVHVDVPPPVVQTQILHSKLDSGAASALGSRSVSVGSLGARTSSAGSIGTIASSGVASVASKPISFGSRASFGSSTVGRVSGPVSVSHSIGRGTHHHTVHHTGVVPNIAHGAHIVSGGSSVFAHKVPVTNKN